MLFGLKNVDDFRLLFADQAEAVGKVGTIFVRGEELEGFRVLKFIVHFYFIG